MPGFKGTLEEWETGKLHSGSKKGRVVKSQKQALAIAYSEAGEPKGSGKGGKRKTRVSYTKIGKAPR